MRQQYCSARSGFDIDVKHDDLVLVAAYALDGIVLIPNCDKIVPGMLMGAVRANIPCVFVSGGPMLAGRMMEDGRKRFLDLSKVNEGMGRALRGEISEADLKNLEEAACPTCGSCAGMFTANSMNCLTEALGMAPAGNGTIPAVMAARIRLAKAAGQAVMTMLDSDDDRWARDLPPDGFATQGLLRRMEREIAAKGG